ncbi:MAG: 16S rRNA (cytidine(1402)-2'-O)-methyltransferase [Pseudomonadota bacterium]
MAPGLHLVSTPIGNAGDVTLRALDVLGRADIIAAEDTRSARRLMEMHGVALGGRRLLAYHDRNGAAVRPALLDALRRGASVALVSDAGTPLIADPGWKLAREALDEALPVTAAPGPSAAITALTLSGLPSDRFLFLGFLPPRKGARRAALSEADAARATLICYESPRRTADALRDMAETLGPDRPGALARELTKRFEEVRRDSLARLAEDAASDPPKGEVVLLVGPAPAAELDAHALDAVLRDALRRMTVSEAAAEAAAVTGAPRRAAYARALELAAGESEH